MSDAVKDKKDVQDAILAAIQKDFAIKRETIVNKCFLTFGLGKPKINEIIDALIETDILTEDRILKFNMEAINPDGTIDKLSFASVMKEKPITEPRKENDLTTDDGYNPDAIYEGDNDNQN